MKKNKFSEITSDELVKQFTAISLEQDEALLGSEIGRFNRLFDKKIAIVSELKARSGDQRKLLLKLFSHKNAQVRLNAAKATLAIAPELARTQLQALVDSKEYPQAGDAGMSIRGLDDGTYKPT
jgi:hypothetical protein